MAHSEYGTIVLAELCGVGTLANQRGYEQAFDAVRHSLDRITQAADSHYGSVDGGFGDWLLTTFDVSKAAANGPHAALVAALAMRSQVAQFARGSKLPIDFSLRVGVDLGPVVCGGRDNEKSDDYAIMGEAVRGATELKDLAPQGRIYVDPDVYHATSESFSFRELEGRVDPEKTGWLPARELLAEGASPLAEGAPVPADASASQADPLLCIRSPWAASRCDEALVFSAVFYFPVSLVIESAALELVPPRPGAVPELLAVAAGVFAGWGG